MEKESIRLDDRTLLKRIRVLVVEDDDLAREQLVRFLELTVARVYQAGDAMAAYECFETERPDMILSDIRMPDVDGIEFVRMVKALDKSLPVVMVTAYNDEQYVEKAAELGVEGYVLKPVDFGELTQVMARCARSKTGCRVDESLCSYTAYLLEGLGKPAAVVSHGRFSYANAPLRERLGYQSLEAFLEKNQRAEEGVADSQGNRAEGPGNIKEFPESEKELWLF